MSAPAPIQNRHLELIAAAAHEMKDDLTILLNAECPDDAAWAAICRLALLAESLQKYSRSAE